MTSRILNRFNILNVTEDMVPSDERLSCDIHTSTKNVSRVHIMITYHITLHTERHEYLHNKKDTRVIVARLASV